MRKNKYGAVKINAYGLTFDSKKEASRYLQLRQLEVAGLITGLETQVSFRLSSNGKHLCKYVADFRYFDEEKKETIVEDVKSAYTAKLPVYRLKKKMMLFEHGINVQEV